MLQRPFRFLQASDFHLEQPPYGMAEVPDHLVELLADAPYRAATRAFDLALAEEVDFVLLAGGLCDPDRAGPRGLNFLGQQFARLAEREIAVYWVTCEADGRKRWPLNLRWPSNVHLFAAHRVERMVHSRRGEPVCQIVGSSVEAPSAIGMGESFALFRDELAASLHDGLFSIGVAPRKLESTLLADLPIRYWGLGGESNSSTPLDLSAPQRMARLSGSPQSRSPDETGAHGCTLVHVDESGQFRVVPTATDVVRWHHERIDVAATMVRSELDHLLRHRIQEIVDAAPDRALLIRWTLSGEAPLLADARRTGLAAELTSSLRVDYGFRTPAAWTVSVAVEPPAVPDGWYEQETLLGDFLRATRSRELSDAPLDLRAYLSERQLAGSPTDWGTAIEPAARRSILRQAAWLGSDLLRPDDADRRGPSPFSAGTTAAVVAEKKGTVPLSAGGKEAAR